MNKWCNLSRHFSALRLKHRKIFVDVFFEICNYVKSCHYTCRRFLMLYTLLHGLYASDTPWSRCEPSGERNPYGFVNICISETRATLTYYVKQWSIICNVPFAHSLPQYTYMCMCCCHCRVANTMRMWILIWCSKQRNIYV